MCETDHTVKLTDGAGRDLGAVLVNLITPAWVCGEFTPGTDFAEVEPLFREFEELANDQIIHLLDPVMDAMRQLGIRGTDGSILRDLQIYPAARGANWRPPAPKR